jgi:ubiquinone biosynthesis protein Coq4
MAEWPPMQWAYARMVAALSPEEREELRKKTLIPLDLAALRAMPKGSVGRAYADYLDEHGYFADYYLRAWPASRETFERNWVMLRWAKTHDFHHVLLGLSGEDPDEIGLQIFNLINFGEPWGAATLLGLPYILLRYKRPLLTLQRVKATVGAGRHMESVLVFPWEDQLLTPVVELRRRFGLPEGGLASAGS